MQALIAKHIFFVPFQNLKYFEEKMLADYPDCTVCFNLTGNKRDDDDLEVIVEICQEI